MPVQTLFRATHVFASKPELAHVIANQLAVKFAMKFAVKFRTCFSTGQQQLVRHSLHPSEPDRLSMLRQLWQPNARNTNPANS
jgi:hypothetical protein